MDILSFILGHEVLSNIIQMVIVFQVFFIFFLKNKREKEDIAKIVVIEIRASEQRIREIKENGINIDVKPIIHINSWEKYKHFFARDLDTDEFILINDFYHKVTRIEAARKQHLVIYNESILEKAKIIQLKLIENIDKNIDKGIGRSNYKKLFLEEVNKETYIFNSLEPSRIIELEIKNIGFVTTSTAGEKIKKIAKMK